VKDLIEMSIRTYGSIFKTPADVLHHLFCVNGNGIELNLKLKFKENYDCQEVYQFPEPTPFLYMYPWTTTERYQPFRDYVGCKDVGFKESVDYFLQCLKITDPKIAGKWLENSVLIGIILSQQVELPTYDKNDVEGFIKSLKSSKTTLDHPVDGTVLPSNDSISKVWFLDAQWSDLPQEIEDEVRQLWKDYELGNDNYIAKREVNDELFNDYPRIYFWCKHKGIPEGETVIIHWWW
jgi:hypothetical protein